MKTLKKFSNFINEGNDIEESENINLNQEENYPEKSIQRLEEFKKELKRLGMSSKKNFKDESPSLSWSFNGWKFDISYEIDENDEFYSLRFVDPNGKDGLIDSNYPIKEIKKLLKIRN